LAAAAHVAGVRVAYFSDSVPPIADGVSRTLCRLVDTLLEEHVGFRFFAAVQPPADLPWARRIHTVPAVPFPAYPTYKVGLPFAAAVDPLVQRFRPDLVHVVSPTLLGLYGLDVARRRRIPVVGSFHTDFASYLPYYGLGALQPQGWKYLRWFYNRCAVTFAPSPSTREQLQHHGIARVALWERGLDPTAFSPRFRSEELRARIGASDRPVLLFVGRLVREKNLVTLAEAAAALAQRGQRFKLVLVGDGPMAPELRRALPDAHFAGFQEGEALARWYASADLFVFPSSTETFGNVILEAFASGLPVVAVNQGGARDLVDPGVNGVLADAASPADLAAAIHTLLERPSQITRLGCQAVQTAARYQWPAVNRRLLDGYRRVLADATRAA
jgi:glycosyltransferase involved in cell wall biosynthesis